MAEVGGIIKKSLFGVKIAPDCVSVIGDVERERRALHEDIEIKYFYEGSSTLLIGTHTVDVNAGDVVIINPYEFHATVSCDDSCCRYHRFMVPLDYFSESDLEVLQLRTLLLADNKVFKTCFNGNERMISLLTSVVQEYKQKNLAYTIAIRALMMEFFIILLRNGLQESSGAGINKNTLRAYHLIEPALRYIRDNYSENVEIEKMCELCKVSKHYFCRVFKAVTGKTAMEYLRDYRITVSDVLLSNTDKSITQISESCGFESANYFCRCYKKYYGISPGKNRSRLKKNK